MTLQIRVVHTDSTEDTLTLKGERVERRFGAKTWGKYFTDRAEATNTTLAETDDEVYLRDTDTSTDLFGGVLRDVDFGKDPKRATLVWDSFEEYAGRAEPTDSSVAFHDVTDQTVVESAVDRVSELSQGSINQTATGLSFTFHFTSPARMIRDVTERAGSEVIYRPDKTVDLVQERGADKTGTTLSPANQNLKDAQVTRKGGDKRITHVVALGESRGADQLSTRVTASSYSQGDPQKWRQVTFKDATALADLRSKAQSWVDTLGGEFLEVSGQVYGPTVDLGDEFTVDYPEKGVSSATLRAVESHRIRDANGLRYEVRLNNKAFVEQAESVDKQAMDVERYNRAAGGYKGVNRRTFIINRLSTRPT